MNKLKIFIAFILIFFCVASYAQKPTLPSGFPSPKSTGYSQNGYYRSDSGWLSGIRDTAWQPISGVSAIVFYNHNYFYWDDNVLYWKPLGSGGGGTGNYVDSIFLKRGLTTDSLNYIKSGLIYTAGLFDRNIGLVSGGIVTYSGLGYVYNVTPAIYYINGARYTANATQVTLAAADPSLDRKDVIVANSSGVITSITGTAATNPIEPQIDPATQVFLAEIDVKAGTTAPTTYTTTTIYDEATEWSFASSNPSGTATNTASPYHLTKATKIDSLFANSSINYTNGSPINVSVFNALTFYIKLNAALSNNTNIRVTFFNGVNQVGQSVTLIPSLGFSKTIVGSYQAVAIPLSLLQTSGNVDKLRIYFTGTSQTGGLYIDWVQLQNGVQQPNLVVDNSAYHSATPINDSTFTLNKPNGDQTTIIIKGGGSGGGGGSTTLQGAINNGSRLTQNNYISSSAHDLTLDSIAALQINAATSLVSSSGSYQQNSVTGYTFSDLSKVVGLSGDSLNFKSQHGNNNSSISNIIGYRSTSTDSVNLRFQADGIYTKGIPRATLPTTAKSLFIDTATNKMYVSNSSSASTLDGILSTGNLTGRSAFFNDSTAADSVYNIGIGINNSYSLGTFYTGNNLGLFLTSKRNGASLKVSDNSNEASGGSGALVIDYKDYTGNSLLHVNGRSAVFNYSGVPWMFTDGNLYTGAGGNFFSPNYMWYNSRWGFVNNNGSQNAITAAFSTEGNLTVGTGFNQSGYKAYINGGTRASGVIQIDSVPQITSSANNIYQRGTTGSSTVTYKVVGRTVTGQVTEASQLFTLTNANAVINATNYVQISLVGIVYSSFPSTFYAGATAYYDVYRISNTGSPNSTGKIGTIDASGASTNDINFFDTGLTGDGTTAPTYNTTGVLGVGTTPTAFVDIQKSVPTQAALRIRPGYAVTSPNKGDIWYDSIQNHLYVNINGTTKQFAEVTTHTYSTPTTGNTITATVNNQNIINPAGTLANLTIALPGSPADNDRVYLKFTQIITTLSFSGGTVVGFPTVTAGLNTFITYNSGTSTWY